MPMVSTGLAGVRGLILRAEGLGFCSRDKKEAQVMGEQENKPLSLAVGRAPGCESLLFQMQYP